MPVSQADKSEIVAIWNLWLSRESDFHAGDKQEGL